MELPGNDAGPAPEGAKTGPTAANWMGYALGAARRRRLLALVVFLAGAVAALAAYRLSTPMYRAETRIMVQNQGFGALGRGNPQDDAPTKAVFDLIHRRENLLALLKHAGVAPEPGAGAGGEGWLARLLGGPATPEDPQEAMIRRLDKALLVTTVDGTITIALQWTTADQAFKLVDGALQNFLEDKHVQEITMADEAISLLQPRVTATREQVERVSEEVRRAAADGEATRFARRFVTTSVPGEPNEDLLQLRGALETKERAISDVEEIRRRRQTDLQSQLDAQRAVLSDAHPTIINLRQDLAALTKDSPQISQLREEARKIRAEYTRIATDPRRKTSQTVVTTSPAYRAAGPATPVEENERVRQARFQHQQMIDRLNVAMLERDAAGAAFKYRYVVSWPAELPRNPSSPSALKYLVAGLLGSLLLALLAPTALELRGARIVERWQVRKQLGLPILAEQGRG